MHAGWFQDPVDRSRQRYWSGTAWTQNILLPGPVPTGLPLPGHVVAVAPTLPAVTTAQPAANAEDPSTARAVDEPAAVAVAEHAGGAAHTVEHPDSSLTTQQILLGLGGALVLTAVIAFVAFIWGTVGPYGQAAILSAIALAFGVAAVRITALLATRETFAVISWGIFVILVVVGPSFGYLPSDLFTDVTFATAAVLAVLTALTMASAMRWRFTVLRLIAWLEYLITVLVLNLAVQDALNVDARAVFAAGLAALAALTLLVPTPVRGWSPRAVVSLVLAGMSGILVEAIALTVTDRTTADSVAMLIVAGVCLAVSRLVRTERLPGVVRMVGFAVLGSAAGMQANGALGLAWEAGLVALVGGMAIVLTYVLGRWEGVAFTGFMWLTWILWLTQSAPVGHEALWAVAAFLGVIAFMSLAFSLATPVHQAVYAFTACGWLAGMLFLALRDVTTVEAYSSLSLAIVLVTLTVLWRVRVLTAQWLRDLSIGATLIATLPSVFAAAVDAGGPGSNQTSLVVALGGAAGSYAWAIIDRRVRAAAWAGAAVLTVMVWIPIGEILPGDPTVEYVTLTATAAFVGAAWIALARAPAVDFSIVTVLVVSAIHTTALWARMAAPERPPILLPATIGIVVLGIIMWEFLAFDRGWTVGFWVAAAILLLTAWIQMGETGIEAPGQYFLVLSAAYLLASVPTRMRHRQLNTLVWLAPAVFAATTPYTIEYGIDAGQSPAWFAVVLAIAVTLALLGGVRGIAGLFVPGTVNVVIIIVAQVLFVVGVIPVWVTLAIGGAVLLAVGVRLEWTRTAVRTGTAWIRELE